MLKEIFKQTAKLTTAELFLPSAAAIVSQEMLLYVLLEITPIRLSKYKKHEVIK